MYILTHGQKSIMMLTVRRSNAIILRPEPAEVFDILFTLFLCTVQSQLSLGYKER